MMRILHVYDDSDITSAHYVAMLTKAIGDRAEMFNATNAKDSINVYLTQADILKRTGKPEEALQYAMLAKKIVGDDYIKNQTFRIGASRLTDRLAAFLT